MMGYDQIGEYCNETTYTTINKELKLPENINRVAPFLWNDLKEKLKILCIRYLESDIRR